MNRYWGRNDSVKPQKFARDDDQLLALNYENLSDQDYLHRLFADVSDHSNLSHTPMTSSSSAIDEPIDAYIYNGELCEDIILFSDTNFGVKCFEKRKQRDICTLVANSDQIFGIIHKQVQLFKYLSNIMIERCVNQETSSEPISVDSIAHTNGNTFSEKSHRIGQSAILSCFRLIDSRKPTDIPIESIDSIMRIFIKLTENETSLKSNSNTIGSFMQNIRFLFEKVIISSIERLRDLGQLSEHQLAEAVKLSASCVFGILLTGLLTKSPTDIFNSMCFLVAISCQLKEVEDELSSNFVRLTTVEAPTDNSSFTKTRPKTKPIDSISSNNNQSPVHGSRMVRSASDEVATDTKPAIDHDDDSAEQRQNTTTDTSKGIIKLKDKPYLYATNIIPVIKPEKDSGKGKLRLKEDKNGKQPVESFLDILDTDCAPTTTTTVMAMFNPSPPSSPRRSSVARTKIPTIKPDALLSSTPVDQGLQNASGVDILLATVRSLNSVPKNVLSLVYESSVTFSNQSQMKVSDVPSPVSSENNGIAASKIKTYVWSCGQNSYNELGHGDVNARKNFTRISSMDNKQIVHVGAGNEHSVFLTKNGKLYVCGYNDNGQCGVGNNQQVKFPSLVQGVLDSEDVAQVHAYNGCEHTLAITREGKLYAFGYNYRGQLGLGSTTSECIPRPVKCLLAHKVTTAACSYHHSLFLCSDGSLFTCGRNDYGQLGHGDMTDRRTPHLVQPTIPDIHQLSCGQFHTAVLTKQNNVYLCGRNDYGQLGIEALDNQKTFTKLAVPSLTNDVITQICCGYYHNLLLSNNGLVFGFGRNDYGQLGLGHTQQKVFACSLIGTLRDKNVINVSAGCYHSVAVTSNGMLYVFGRNNHGQLGTGDLEERHIPHPVDDFLGKQIISIAAGFYHTLILMSQDTSVSACVDDSVQEFIVSAPMSPSKRNQKSIQRVVPSASEEIFLSSKNEFDAYSIVDEINPVSLYFQELSMRESAAPLPITSKLFDSPSLLSINDLLGYLAENLFSFIGQCGLSIVDLQNSKSIADNASKGSGSLSVLEKSLMIRALRVMTILIELCRYVITEVIEIDIPFTTKQASTLLRTVLISAKVLLSQQGNKLSTFQSNINKSMNDSSIDQIEKSAPCLSELFSRPHVRLQTAKDIFNDLAEVSMNGQQSDESIVDQYLQLSINGLRQEIFSCYFYLPSNDISVGNYAMSCQSSIDNCSNSFSQFASSIGQMDASVSHRNISNTLGSVLELNGSIISKHFDIFFPSLTHTSQIYKAISSQLINIAMVSKAGDDALHDSMGSFDMEFEPSLDFSRSLRLFCSVCFRYRSINDVVQLVRQSRSHGLLIFQQLVSVYNTLSMVFIENQVWPLMNASSNEVHRVLGALDHCNSNFCKAIFPILFRFSATPCLGADMAMDQDSSMCNRLGYQIAKDILSSAETVIKHLMNHRVFDDPAITLRNVSVLPTILPTLLLYGIATCDDVHVNADFKCGLHEGIVKDIQSLCRALVNMSRVINSGQESRSSAFPSQSNHLNFQNKLSNDTQLPSSLNSTSSSIVVNQSAINHSSTSTAKKDITSFASSWWGKLLKLCNLLISKIGMTSFRRSRWLISENAVIHPVSRILNHSMWCFYYSPSSINKSIEITDYEYSSILTQSLVHSLRAREMSSDGIYRSLIISKNSSTVTMMEQIESVIFDMSVANLFNKKLSTHLLHRQGDGKAFQKLWQRIAALTKIIHSKRSELVSSSNLSWQEIIETIKSIVMKLGAYLSNECKPRFQYNNSFQYLSKQLVIPRVSFQAIRRWKRALLVVIGAIRWQSNYRRRVSQTSMVTVDFIIEFISVATNNFSKIEVKEIDTIWNEFITAIRAENTLSFKFVQGMKIFESLIRSCPLASMKTDVLMVLMEAFQLRSSFNTYLACCVSMESFSEQQIVFKRLKTLMLSTVDDFVKSNPSSSTNATMNDLVHLSIVLCLLHKLYNDSDHDMFLEISIDPHTLLHLLLVTEERATSELQSSPHNDPSPTAEQLNSSSIGHAFVNFCNNISSQNSLNSIVRSIFSLHSSVANSDVDVTSSNKGSQSNNNKKSNSRERTKVLRRLSHIIVSFLQSMASRCYQSSMNSTDNLSSGAFSTLTVSRQARLADNKFDSLLEINVWLCSYLQTARLAGSRSIINDSESFGISNSGSTGSITNLSFTASGVGIHAGESMMTESSNGSISSGLGGTNSRGKDTATAKRKYQDLISKPMEFHRSQEGLVFQGDKLLNSIKGSEFTLSMWIFLTKSNGSKNSFITGKVSHNDAWPLITLRGDSKLEVFYGHGNDLDRFTSQGTIPLMSWTHIAFVIEQKKIKIFINGVADAQASSNKTNGRAILYPVLIGTCPSSVRTRVEYVREGFDGIIASYKYYTRALSPIHVKVFFDQGPPESLDYKEKWLYRMLSSIALLRLSREYDESKVLNRDANTTIVSNKERLQSCAADSLLMIFITESFSSRVRCSAIINLERFLLDNSNLRDISLTNNSGFASARYSGSVHVTQSNFLTHYSTVQEKIFGYFIRIVGACLSPHLSVLASQEDSSSTILASLDLKNPFSNDADPDYALFKEFMAYVPYVIISKGSLPNMRTGSGEESSSNNSLSSSLISKLSCRMDQVHECIYHILHLLDSLSLSKYWQNAATVVTKSIIHRSRLSYVSQSPLTSLHRLDLLGVMAFLGNYTADTLNFSAVSKAQMTVASPVIGPFIGAAVSSKYSEGVCTVLTTNKSTNSVTLLTKSQDSRRHVMFVLKGSDVQHVRSPNRSYGYVVDGLVTEIVIFMKTLIGYTRLSLHDAIYNPSFSAANPSSPTTANTLSFGNLSLEHPFLRHVILRYIRPLESFYYLQMLTFLQGIFASAFFKLKDCVIDSLKSHPELHQFFVFSSLAINRIHSATVSSNTETAASGERKSGMNSHGSTLSLANGTTPRSGTPMGATRNIVTPGGSIPGAPSNPSAAGQGLQITPGITPRTVTPLASSNRGANINGSKPIPTVDVTESLLPIADSYLGSGRFLVSVPDRTVTVDISDNDTDKLLLDFFFKHLGVNSNSVIAGSQSERYLKRGSLREFILSCGINDEEDLSSMMDTENIYLVSSWNAQSTSSSNLLSSFSSLGKFSTSPISRGLNSISDHYPFTMSGHSSSQSNLINSMAANLPSSSQRLQFSELDDSDRLSSLRFVSNMRHNIVILSRSLVQAIPMLLQFQTTKLSRIPRLFLVWQSLLPHTASSKAQCGNDYSNVDGEYCIADSHKQQMIVPMRKQRNASDDCILTSDALLLTLKKSSPGGMSVIALFEQQIQFLALNVLEQSQYRNPFNILESSDLFFRAVQSLYRWTQSFEDHEDEAIILHEISKILMKTLMNVFSHMEGCEVHMMLMRLSKYIVKRLYFLQVRFMSYNGFRASPQAAIILTSTLASSIMQMVENRIMNNQVSTIVRLRATELLAKERGRIHVNPSIIEGNAITFAYQLAQLTIGIERTQRNNVVKPMIKQIAATLGQSQTIGATIVSAFISQHLIPSSSRREIIAATSLLVPQKNILTIDVETMQPAIADIRSTSVSIDIGDSICDLVEAVSAIVSSLKLSANDIATGIGAISDYIAIELALSPSVEGETPVYEVIYYGSAHTISHSGLSPGCIYSMKARAVIGGVYCHWSSPISFQTHSGLMFTFDPLQAGPDIVISPDGLTATYSGDDNWSTVLCSQAFSAGVVSWEVRVNHSLTAYVFVGIASSLADLSTFLGGDSHGYGFIGEQALYHNREKVKIYGESFGVGDVIRVTVDFTLGTLSFAKNGQSLGVAFDKIFGSYYPAVAFYNVGQEIEILPDKFSATVLKDIVNCAVSHLNMNDLSMLSELIFCVQTMSPFSFRLLHIIASSLEEWCSGVVYRCKTATGKYIYLSTQSPILIRLGFHVNERIRTPYGVAEVAGVAHNRLWFRFASNQSVWYFTEKQIVSGREKGFFHRCSYSQSSPTKSPKAQLVSQMAALSSNTSIRSLMMTYTRNSSFNGSSANLTPSNISVTTDTSNQDLNKASTMMFDPLTLSDLIDSSRWTRDMDSVLVSFLLRKAEKLNCSPWNVPADSIVDDFRSVQQALSKIVISNIEMTHRWGVSGPKRKAVIARLGVLRFLNHMLEQYLPVLLHDELAFEKYDNVRYQLQQSHQSNSLFGMRQQRAIGDESYPVIVSTSHDTDISRSKGLKPSPGSAKYVSMPTDVSVIVSSSLSPLSTSQLLALGSLACIRCHIFTDLKLSHFWDIVIRSTGRPSKTDDDYDYPEELPQIKINRLKSFCAREASELIHIPGEDLYLSSMFCQLWHELRKYPQENLRISYTHPMDDGQSRSFKVKFESEGVDDYGGPYREILQQICDELQFPDPSHLPNASKAGAAQFHRASTRVGQAGREAQSNGGGSASSPCFVPLLFPTPNWSIDSDELVEKYKYMFHPASTSAVRLDLYRFLGQIVGIAIRSRITLDLCLSSIVWKCAVREILSEEDINSFDHTAYAFVKQLKALLLRKKSFQQQSPKQSKILQTQKPFFPFPNATEESAVDLEISSFLEDVTWTAKRSDQTIIELIPNGRNIPVKPHELERFLCLFIEAKLTESQQATSSFRVGLLSIIPYSAISLLSGEELERIVCGSNVIDVNRLKENTEYDDDISVDDPHIVNFWDVLANDFDEAEKSAFLRFVWARPTLPPKDVDFPQKFKIQSSAGDDTHMKPDQYLPKAHTCFFSLNLPRYSSKQMLAEKLRYAIFNCTEMDADFRLTDSEVVGWVSGLPAMVGNNLLSTINSEDN